MAIIIEKVFHRCIDGLVTVETTSWMKLKRHRGMGTLTIIISWGCEDKDLAISKSMRNLIEVYANKDRTNCLTNPLLIPLLCIYVPTRQRRVGGAAIYQARNEVTTSIGVSSLWCYSQSPTLLARLFPRSSRNGTDVNQCYQVVPWTMRGRNGQRGILSDRKR